MTALRKLIEAVEAGTLDTEGDWRWLCDLFPMSQSEVVAGDYESDHVANIRHAYHGSLDTAKSLHDAMLPGWHPELREWPGGVFIATLRPPYTPFVRGQSTSLARSWLLAILKAYEAQQ